MLDSLNPSLIVGVDVSEIALSLAASNIPESARLVRADISRGLPLDDGAFDVATIFGVLCHQWVESEATVLAETARILRPGGLVLLTEPAFDAMTREIHDITLTKRRYRHADFDAWFASAGFETLFSSYFTSFGFPIILAAKRFMRGKPGGEEAPADMRPIPGFTNEILLGAAMLEAWVIGRGIPMPFGTTLVRVARRRE